MLRPFRYEYTVHAVQSTVQRLKSFSECSSKFTITAQLFTRFTPSLPEPTLSQSGVDSPAQRRLQPARTQRLALVALMTSTCLVSPTSPRQQLVLLYCVRHTQRASAPLGCQDSRSATGVGSFHHAPLLHTSHHAYCTSLASIEGCARVGRAASRAPPPPSVSLLPRCRLRVLQLAPRRLAPRRLAPGRSVARCSVRGYDEGVRVDGDGLRHLVRLHLLGLATGHPSPEALLFPMVHLVLALAPLFFG